MRLYVDGDEYLFKAAAALEHETQWDAQNHVLWSNCEEVWAAFVQRIDDLCRRFNVTDPERDVWLTFGSPPYFRTALHPSYKAGRPDRKPICYATLRKRCDTAYRRAAMPGLEADDVMGILATAPELRGGAIVCSQDKDMQTLPVQHWDGEGLVAYTEAQADYFHMLQTLTGDKTDGYPGCPGIGPVKAEKLLGGTPNNCAWDTAVLWQRVVEAYVKAGLTEETALLQARLARILRWTDWDATKKEPKLWLPPPSI